MTTNNESKDFFLKAGLVGSEYFNFFDVTENISGTIISVYSRAINIFYEERELLISLVKEKSQMSALSLFVPLLFELPGLLDGNINGASVGMSENLVRFMNFRIQVSRDKKWDETLNLDSINTGWSSQLMLKETVEYLSDILLSLVGAKGFALIVASLVLGEKVGRIDEKYVEYAIGYLKRLEEEARENVHAIDLSGLVGLGVGFTPSGDDFITGALLAESIVAGISIDKLSIEKRLKSTTYGGKTLLWQGIRAKFPFYLTEGVGKLSVDNARRDTEKIIQELTSHGSTSGTDAFVGFLWYLYFNRKFTNFF